MTYSPQFPFKDNQIILSSNRIFLHSKTDSIFLFGNSAVSLSSMKSVNIDALDKTVICSPKIELCGLETVNNSERKLLADQQVILGNNLVSELTRFVEKVIEAAKLLNEVSSDEKQLMNSMKKITDAAAFLNKGAVDLKNVLDAKDSYVLSKVTYTA